MPIDLPVAVSIFRGDFFTPPKVWGDQTYSKLFYWNEVPKGGTSLLSSNLSCSLRNCARASRRCADCGASNDAARELSQGRFSQLAAHAEAGNCRNQVGSRRTPSATGLAFFTPIVPAYVRYRQVGLWNVMSGELLITGRPEVIALGSI